MSNVQIVPFSISGDLNILKDEEPELDVDAIEKKKAILYSIPEENDSMHNINIILKLAPNGMYVFTYNLNEQYLQYIFKNGTLNNNEFTLEKLRYLLRCKLLDFDTISKSYDDAWEAVDHSILVNNYELETQLIIENSGKYYYKIYVNEKIAAVESLTASDSVKNDLFSGLNKRICEFMINDSMSDSVSAVHPDLNTEDYLYLSCDLNKKKNLQLQLFDAKMDSQSQEIGFLRNKIEELHDAYNKKINTIEDVSVKIINAKKEKIRIMIERIENLRDGGGNDRDSNGSNTGNGSSADDLYFVKGDQLNSLVETTDTEAEENAEDDEDENYLTENGKRKYRKKMKKYKEPTRKMKKKFTKTLDRKTESFHSSSTDSNSEDVENTSLPTDQHIKTFVDEDEMPAIKEEPDSIQIYEKYPEDANTNDKDKDQSPSATDRSNFSSVSFKKKFVSTPNDLRGSSFEGDYKVARKGNRSKWNKNHSNYVNQFQTAIENNDDSDRSFDRSFNDSQTHNNEATPGLSKNENEDFLKQNALQNEVTNYSDLPKENGTEIIQREHTDVEDSSD